ncbi:MAG: hypothetical protein BWY99_01999 [Synergistetes bacterium ADurb.BinA166]|nr:MAG: hypothetical protein BWY99_01999 [Synergistetes bacterium ADurb.BinA166]
MSARRSPSVRRDRNETVCDSGLTMPLDIPAVMAMAAKTPRNMVMYESIPALSASLRAPSTTSAVFLSLLPVSLTKVLPIASETVMTLSASTLYSWKSAALRSSVTALVISSRSLSISALT